MLHVLLKSLLLLYLNKLIRTKDKLIKTNKFFCFFLLLIKILETSLIRKKTIHQDEELALRNKDSFPSKLKNQQ